MSYIVPMTIDWVDAAEAGGRTRYRALAETIAAAIADGRLKAGEQLPTHRALAERLDVSIGTVTRAYAEAERRGLVSGEVGRGTFVRAVVPRSTEWGGEPGDPEMLDLSLALPWVLPGGEEGRLLSAALAGIAAEPGLEDLLRYHPGTALPRHRAAAARWLEGAGVPTGADRVFVTPGAQHALSVLLMTLLRPGDVVLAEALTYPGLIALSRALDRPLHGVEMDGEGMLPSALERAVRETGGKLVYVVPTAQNPTGATMSAARRRAIVEVARAHDLLLIEDDVHGLLAPHPRAPAFAALAPEHTVHVITFSKALTFGLRTAFVSAPARHVDALIAGVRSTVWISPPLMTELTLRWLTDGTADRLMERKRAESEARQALVAEVLGGCGRLEHERFAGHAWLHLPEPWRADELVAEARRRGVQVTPASMFATGRANAPHAIRLCVGTPRDRAVLRRGLETLATILEHGPPPVAAIV